MKKIGLFIAPILLAACSQQPAPEQTTQSTPEPSGTVRVLSDRTETHLKPLFDLFEENTGSKVEAVYSKSGMLSRLQAQPTESDIVISSTAEVMETARTENLLQAFDAKVVEGVADSFVDPDRMYAITSYRPRSFFYSRERVKPEELSTYMALTDPKWKGRVSIRSGYHPYNMSLFCQMVEAYGPEKTRTFLAGLKANLARTPQGNDRAQVEAIYNGIADVSIGNSYYMPLMLERDDQRPWGEATEVFFPNQKEDGAFVMCSAAGLTSLITPALSIDTIASGAALSIARSRSSLSLRSCSDCLCLVTSRPTAITPIGWLDSSKSREEFQLRTRREPSREMISFSYSRVCSPASSRRMLSATTSRIPTGRNLSR